ncbi:MAG: hypothetical protein FWG66_05455 [Spirochaetes bacterium]|nr:hypothetical protein [Spirochaetota bacterium]
MQKLPVFHWEKLCDKQHGKTPALYLRKLGEQYGAVHQQAVQGLPFF